jgi:hypothetical protein
MKIKKFNEYYDTHGISGNEYLSKRDIYKLTLDDSIINYKFDDNINKIHTQLCISHPFFNEFLRKSPNKGIKVKDDQIDYWAKDDEWIVVFSVSNNETLNRFYDVTVSCVNVRKSGSEFVNITLDMSELKKDDFNIELDEEKTTIYYSVEIPPSLVSRYIIPKVLIPIIEKTNIYENFNSYPFNEEGSFLN